MKPERLARTIIYQSPWVNLYVDRVRFPGGRIIETHHFLDFEKDGVAVLVENDRAELLFVEAYRYVTDSLGWEIPAGGVEKGEAVLAAAQREVWEESGYETTGHRLIYTYHPNNGIANKVFHVVGCQAGSCTGSFDCNEVAGTAWFSRQQIWRMIRQQEIKSGFTLTALLLHFSEAHHEDR